MHLSKSLVLLFLLLVMSFSACDKDSTTQVTQNNTAETESELNRLIEEFSKGFYALNPTVAVSNGLHDYDGKLPDYSAKGIQQSINWYRQMGTRIESIDAGNLSDSAWLYREQLQFVVDSSLFYLEDLKVMENNAWYGYDSIDPDVYLSRAYAPLETRIRAFIEHVQGMSKAVPDIRNNLRPMPSSYAHVLQDYMSGLAEFISTTPNDVFSELNDPLLHEQMSVSTSKAARELNSLSAWIETQPRNEDYALGEEKFARMLWALERIDTPLAELRALAEADLERNLQAMDKACAEFSPATSISECTAKVYANKYEDGPVAGATRQLEMLKQVLLDKEIVTIPGDDVALVAEAPPHQRSNAAYIIIPGPHEKGMPSVYYIAPPDPGWSPEEQLAYVPGRMDLLATSVHEVWPGHFLEGLHGNLSGNPVSELAYSYAYSEGWAHYTEEMMADEALDYDAEMKIGQLLNALLRNARFVSALGLHTSGMSVQESERLFREKGLQDPANARQQAARGTFDPGYLFYTVGKLMIKKLRADWMQANPDKSLKEFHDQFLAYGSAPIPLIRKMMLGRDENGELF